MRHASLWLSGVPGHHQSEDLPERRNAVFTCRQPSLKAKQHRIHIFTFVGQVPHAMVKLVVIIADALTGPKSAWDPRLLKRPWRIEAGSPRQLL